MGSFQTSYRQFRVHFGPSLSSFCAENHQLVAKPSGVKTRSSDVETRSSGVKSRRSHFCLFLLPVHSLDCMLVQLYATSRVVLTSSIKASFGVTLVSMAKRTKSRAAASGLHKGVASSSDQSCLEKDKATSVKAEPISIEDKIKEASFRACASCHISI